MLQPKKTKFRKMHKMPPKGNTKRGDQLAFGSFGLKAIQGAWITDRQIEAAGEERCCNCDEKHGNRDAD